MRKYICTIICNNFCDNTHIMFLLFISIILVSVSISTFLCKSMIVPKIVTQIVV